MPPSTPPAKCPLPFMCASFTAGRSGQYLGRIVDEETKTLALCERHYYRSEGKACCRLAQGLLQSKTGCIRISARLMCGFGALCMGDSRKAAKIFGDIRSAFRQKTAAGHQYTQLEQQLVAFTHSLAVVLLHQKKEAEAPPLDLLSLPMGIRLVALYVEAHQQYLHAHYGEAIGIAKTALALKDGPYPVGETYLQLMLAMCYLNQMEAALAREHFCAAWEIAKAEKFYQPFAEHHGLLGGMVEIHLRKSEPEAFAAINEQVYRFAQAWRDIHNTQAGPRVADVLTTSEFTVAMLASKGWSNEQMAQHLGCTLATVKTHLRRTNQKLGTRSRKELARHLLQ